MANAYALAYARVSTPGQAQADLSIPAQLKAIASYAVSNEITILQEYIDEGISAYRDVGKRRAFMAMLEHAKTDSRVAYILVHELSRFSRDKYQSNADKYELRKHGVSVVSVSSPYDANTDYGNVMESIEEAMAMSSSMTTAKHVRKAMRENASKKDPQTGYCYKNGGMAPYGYKLVKVNVGRDTRGKAMEKLLWDVDSHTSAILRMIIVDWRIGEALSYDKIRDRLNEMGIPGPMGKPWSTSTIVYMLREDRLFEYAGTYFWNKVGRKASKRKPNDRTEWVEVKDAHPAIITEDEAKAALALSASRQPRTPASRSYDSRWLLTGLNLEGKPFFTCKACGSNMIGAVIARPRGIGKYLCGPNHYKGKYGCTNNLRISQPQLEETVFSEIERVFGAPHAIEDLARDINNRLTQNNSSYNEAVKAIKKQVKEAEEQIEATFRAFASGLDPELCNQRLNRLKSDLQEYKDQLAKREKDRPQMVEVDPFKASNMFKSLSDIYASGSNEQKRLFIRTFIRRMEFDPEENLVTIVFYALGLQEVIKHGDIPRSISGGAGDRDRTGTG